MAIAKSNALPSIAAILWVAVAHAATFGVNGTIDATDATPGDGVCESAPGNALCTLRAAIEETNALPGADVIDLPGGVYELLSGQLLVAGDLTLNGAGAGTTIIDAGGRSRGLCVDVVTATIAGVTVRNGFDVNEDCVGSNYGGGGIHNAGTLTLSDSVVSANDGGALGGGIFSEGELTIAGSTIANNSADFGGGLLVLGPTTLRNSTVSGNDGSVYAGGISAGFCVFACVRAADVLLNNVTITHNTAGYGGGVYVFGDGAETNSSLVASNSVIAGNSDRLGGTPDCAPAIGSAGYNLIGSTAGCGIWGDPTGNVTGVSPKLGPLAGNGGPTPTHAPLPDSSAIEAGNPAVPGSGGTACEALDQRGVTRPQGARCEMGAVEFGGTPPPSTTTSTTTTIATSSTTTTILPFCAAAPRFDCQLALSGKGSLLVKDRADDAKDAFSWKWRSSATTAKAAFGAPTATTDYAVCVYDQSGGAPTRRMAATAPGDGVCAGRACWSEASNGFRYVDPEYTPDGLATIRLQAGEAGAGRIWVTGRGTALPLPSLPLIAPVTVQLQRRDGGACWTATFSAPATNTPDRFKSKVD